MDHKTAGHRVADLWRTENVTSRRWMLAYLTSIPPEDARLVLFWVGYFMDDEDGEDFYEALLSRD